MSGIRRINRGKGHSYSVDGVRYDGVTTLLGNGLPKPALVNWAANVTAGYAIDHWNELGHEPVSKRLEILKKARWADLNQAAARGTDVHAIADQLVHGVKVDVPEHLAGHVESCVKFLDEWEPEPILTETVIANRRWRYAGSTDGVFRLRDGRKPIIEWKTTRSGLFPETALQLSAYANADVYLDQAGDEQPMADVGITHGLGIHLRADGYSVYELDISEAVFKDFLHIAWCARMTERMSEWKSEELSPPIEAGVA